MAMATWLKRPSDHAEKEDDLKECTSFPLHLPFPLPLHTQNTPYDEINVTRLLRIRADWTISKGLAYAWSYVLSPVSTSHTLRMPPV